MPVRDSRPSDPVGNGTIAKTRKYFSVYTVLLPVVIGLAVVVVLLWRDASAIDWKAILSGVRFDFRTVCCIALALACVFGRDFGLTWRFRELTGCQITWPQAWRVDLMCEFTSCVTPSAVGGSSLGMVFLNVEGVELGKATTLMMTTLLLDELFFVVACPIVVLCTPIHELFASQSTGFSYGLEFTFWVVYSIIALWTAILFVGIILKPGWIRGVIERLFRWRLLRRWSHNAQQLGDNMIATSAWLRGKNASFWLKVFAATALSWLSRFLVVNVLFLAFVPAADPHQWLVLAREFVIWLVLMLCPTPGGAGLSEWLFTGYYGDLLSVAGMGLLLAVVWRILSYYIYLVIGVCIFPSWVKDAVHKIKN